MLTEHAQPIDCRAPPFLCSMSLHARLVDEKTGLHLDEGGFSRVNYMSEPYDNTVIRYSKVEPLEKRQRGFLSRAPAARDEFTMDVRVEQWRQQLAAERKVAEKVLASSLARAGLSVTSPGPGGGGVAVANAPPFSPLRAGGAPDDAGFSNSASLSPRRRNFTLRTQYDRLHDLRSTGDLYGTATIHKPTGRHLDAGMHATSAQAIGDGMDTAVLESPKHRVVNSMRDFYRPSGVQLGGE